MNVENEYVWVRRQWNDHRKAKYRLSGIWNVRWDSISGGVQATSPRPFLYGRAMCDAMVEGELAHSCMHGDAPHEIKVCIVQKDNLPSVYAQLVARTGPRPASKPRRKTFYQWLMRKGQLERADAVGDFARCAKLSARRPRRNTCEAWKRRLKARKGSVVHEILKNVWAEYQSDTHPKEN